MRSGGKRFQVEARLPFLVMFLLIGIILTIRPDVGLAGTANPLDKGLQSTPPASITLTLDQTLELALLNNRSIASARVKAESQQYDVVTAKSDFDLKINPLSTVMYGSGNVAGGNNVGLGLSLRKKLETGPTVSLSPTYNRSDQQGTSSLGLTVELPLFKGFGEDVNLNTVRAAEFARQSAARNIDQTRTNISLETISTFYNAIKQKDVSRLYVTAGQKLKGHSAIARAKEKVGLSTPMDTYRAEISLKETENAATQAQEAHLDALDRLKVILSLPLKTEISLITPESIRQNSIDLPEAIETALNNRIEIIQARAEVAEGERRLEVLKNNTLPGIKLVMNAGQYAAADNLGQPLNLYQNNWSIMLQGTTDLQRTAEKAAYQQGLLAIRSLRLDLENRREEIDKQVRKQWMALKENEKRIRIRKEQIQQAREKLALAEVKYAHDLANNFDIIEAESELQKARVMVLSEEMDYAVGIFTMKAVLGILLPKN